MSWTNIFMVPLIMVCALGGTVGLVSLIKHYHNRNDNKNNKDNQ